jgi:uncharacterized coiled-coil protein SlyX
MYYCKIAFLFFTSLYIHLKIMLFAIILLLIIIIIWMIFKRKNILAKKLCKAETEIDMQAKEIKELNDGICQQGTAVEICRGDLVSCDGKHSSNEVEFTNMIASVTESNDRVAVMEEELELCKTLSYQLKKAVDAQPCSFGIVTKEIAQYDKPVSELLSRIKEQDYLIQSMRATITDRNARIGTMERRTLARSGMY